MAHSLIINNLTKRRAYLTGEIGQAKRALKKLRSERYTIDKMLRLIDSGINPDTIKGIQRHYRMPGFKHGEMTRLCVATMRRADAPLSASDIAKEVARLKAIDATGAVLQRVRLTMVRLARDGRVTRSGLHRARLWALAPE